MSEVKKRLPCPICGKPCEARWRPFCSQRCADVDLGRWFLEAYRLPCEGIEAEWTEARDPARAQNSREVPR